MPADSIFDDPVTHLLSRLYILIELFSRAHAQGGEELNGFKFATFIGRFPNDGAASMAEKGLKAGQKKLEMLILPSFSVQLNYALLLWDPPYIV